MEKANFCYAGKTVAEVWSNMLIDCYPVITEFIAPGNSEIIMLPPWQSNSQMANYSC